MTATVYQSWVSTQLAPSFLRGPWGTKWNTAMGLQSDLLVAQAQQAVASRIIASAPADALPYIGQDRQIPRYASDTDTSYRARLQAAWTTWQAGGTYTGLYTQLLAYGFAPASVGIFDVHGDASVPGGTGLGPGGATPWPPDSNTTNWSRFWVALTPPFPTFLQWQARFWGASPTGSGGTWGQLGPDGTPYTWGSTATAAQAQTIKRLVKQWKPVQCICAGIWIMYPTGTLYWDGT